MAVRVPPGPETRKLRVQKTVAEHAGAASGSLCESGRPVGPASVLSRGAVRAEWKKGSPARVPDCLVYDRIGIRLFFRVDIGHVSLRDL